MAARYQFAVVDTSVLLALYNRKDGRHRSAADSLAHAARLVVSPMVLAELDYLLTARVNGTAAANALASLKAWATTDQIQLATVNWGMLGEAHQLMHTCAQRDAIGLTDSVNAVLAWKLPEPVVLSFDHHYRDVIAPRTTSEASLQVLPETS